MMKDMSGSKESKQFRRSPFLDYDRFQFFSSYIVAGNQQLRSRQGLNMLERSLSPFLLLLMMILIIIMGDLMHNLINGMEL